MTVLTVDKLRERIDTPASSVALLDLLTTIEARLVDALGNPYTDADTAISEIHMVEGRNLFTRRRIGSVTAVSEYRLGNDDWIEEALTEGSDFLVWPGQGRIERRQAGWGARVVVQYVPQDDRAAWREAELDLARIALSRSALKAESVGGEYSFTAPDSWEDEMARVIQRLSWPSL